MIDGEVLSPESPVMVPFSKYRRFRGKNEGRKFLSTAIIERDIRQTMRSCFQLNFNDMRGAFKRSQELLDLERNVQQAQEIGSDRES